MRAFLQIVTIASIFISSYFWIRCGVWFSPTSIASVSETRFDYNDDLVRTMTSQSADCQVAFALLVISVLSQFGLCFIPQRIGDLGAFTYKEGIIILVLMAVFYFAGNQVSRALEKSYYKRVIKILTTERQDREKLQKQGS